MTEDRQASPSARELAAEYAAGTVFDITECAREPIHLLGSVQSHGALLALAEPDLTVTVASANTTALLGVAPEALLGLPVADLLGAEQARQIREATAREDGVAAIVPVRLEERAAGYQLEVSVHRGDGLVICEFEPAAGEPFRFSSFYPGVRRALLRLEGTLTVTGLCEAAVREVRAFTGYDRVVAYRFDGDGPGEVIAEDAAPGWEPWLGLWFPAIDVPPQARRLYLQNWIRVIADVDDPGAALLPPLRPGLQRPLDLSGSALRTVSNYHLEYLRNIGVRGSMSVSLVKDGRLWGLIACHSGTPRRLTPEQRAACEMLGIALSLQLASAEDRQRAAGEAEARKVLRQLTDVAGAAGPERFGEQIAAACVRLGELIGGEGFYARFGAATSATGLVPDLPGMPALLAGLPSAPVGQAWSTHSLREALADLAPLAGDCAGVLMVRLSSGGDVLAWFRGEVSRTVRWAADPGRPVVTGSRGQRLTPRGSATVWQETVRGQSLPWSAGQHGIAEEAYRALFEVAVRRAAARSAAAGEDLASLEDATGTQLAVRMDGLLSSLLEYSRLVASDAHLTPVSLDDVLDEIAEVLGARFAEAGVQLRRPVRLGTVSGDRIRMQEVLVSLVSNALMHAAADPPGWVEVGSEQTVPPGAGQPVRAFCVRDSGTSGTGGRAAGAALSVSQRIVERNGGQLWLGTEPGPGTTFYFTL